MISQRQQKILKLIVENYIKKAKPIGSKSICDNLKCSSATIRNEMVFLEEEGYLEKTHTSSGRIPSEKGYRYYVDYLMRPKEMSGAEMLQLQTIFQNKALQLNDAITRSMEIISEITNYTAVVLGDLALENRLQKVEVVPLSETDLIAIVITNTGFVEHKKLKITSEIALLEIKKMVDLINNLLIGTLINEVSQKLEFEIKPIISKYIKQHEMVYNVFYDAFNDLMGKESIHLAGRGNILKQPEFDNVKKIHNLIEKFEDHDLINQIKEESNNINIYIGKENALDENVAIIKTGYNVDGVQGTIAIIGPKRMEYNKVVGLLEYIKENIER